MLISRVAAFITILWLSAGRQYGYRDSVINYSDENETVALQLPRTVSKCDLVVYVKRRNEHRSKLVRVETQFETISLSPLPPTILQISNTDSA